MGPTFPSKWPKAKCPACGDPWEVGDPVMYNDDNVVVHEQCAIEAIPTLDVYKGPKMPKVCDKCHLVHSYPCEE